MPKIQFFFLADKYYTDFPDIHLMRNKEADNTGEHKRPCFFALEDFSNPQIKWIVPVSSQSEKYLEIAEKKTKRFGKCNTIIFGDMLGRQTAFLIQNMCPATDVYLIPYLDRNNIPIRIQDKLAAEIASNAKDVLRMYKRGIKLVFPDIISIYDKLLDTQAATD